MVWLGPVGRAMLHRCGSDAAEGARAGCLSGAGPNRLTRAKIRAE
jgi:hypothetical protein